MKDFQQLWRNGVCKIGALAVDLALWSIADGSTFLNMAQHLHGVWYDFTGVLGTDTSALTWGEKMEDQYLFPLLFLHQSCFDKSTNALEGLFAKCP